MDVLKEPKYFETTHFSVVLQTSVCVISCLCRCEKLLDSIFAANVIPNGTFNAIAQKQKQVLVRVQLLVVESKLVYVQTFI